MRSSRVRARARSRPDNGGDPLDGLVNLFDLGVVLAVAFLLAALASLDLTGVLTRGEVTVVRRALRARRSSSSAARSLQRLRLAPGERVGGAAARPSGASTGCPTAGSSTRSSRRERVLMDFIWDGMQAGGRADRQRRPRGLRDRPGDAAPGAVVDAAGARGRPAVGLALGLGRFRGRGPAVAVANAGMGLPPVVVGLVVALLLFRGAPLGGLNLLYTLNGVILAQALLALPVVVALTASSVQSLPAGLIEQARAFGASRPAVAALALREARVGMLAATIAAAGSAFAEVGAVVLVGGNIDGQTQTLASAVLVRVSAGEYGTAIALGAILLGLVLLLAAALTVLQQRRTRTVLGRPS